LPSLDLTTALGRLLSNGPLRAAFRRHPRDVADHLSLRAFLALDPAELEAQATALLHKRFCEVEDLLPVSVARLGCQAWPLFESYALTSWPVGHRRHLWDALGFVQFVGDRAGELSQTEIHRVRFTLNGDRLSVRWVGDMFIKGRFRHGLQVLYRKSGQVRGAALYMRT
jgi:hypothetical protein